MPKKNKLTKPTHSEHYLIATAKQCVYPVDIYQKVITVPDSEKETYRDCLGACHLIDTCGFAVELVIGEVIKKNLYSPELSNRVKKEAEEFRYKVGQQFRMVSGFRQIELTKVTEKKLDFKYIGNVVRADSHMKPEDLDRALLLMNASEIVKG